jgi:very-short-patch-repair endonuclease
MFTGDSARLIKGIPRLGHPELKPHCLSDKRKNSDVIEWHYGKLDPNAVVQNGYLVVSDIRMICDLATTDTPECLLVSLNHCLHEELFTKEQLLAALENRPGMKGGNLLKRLLRFATPKCESPLETIATIYIYKAGLKMPQQQVDFYEKGRRFARVDMYWEVRKRKIVLELDGQIKYKDEQVRFREKIREDKLREQGCEVIRATWSDVMNGQLVQKLIDKNIPLRRNFSGTFPQRHPRSKN